MMNPLDIFILAHTKLRSRPIRTWFTISLAGLLFGIIIAAIVIMQGVFVSIDKYSAVGLNNRTLIGVAYAPQSKSFDEYNHMSDAEFVNEIDTAYKAEIAQKQAVAKKYSVDYDPTISDPSPVGIDPITKQKVITNDGITSQIVQQLAQKRRDALGKPFSITEYLKPYKSATLRGTLGTVQPASGALTYMKNGQENQQVSSSRAEESMIGSGSGASLTLLDSSVSKPFITSTHFDSTKGEIPVILPFSDAEKLLGLSKLSKDASPAERKERLEYVRAHVSEATASFCYRNEASRVLLGQATAQQAVLQHATNNLTDYTKPSLLYNAPSMSDCSAITVKSDTRSEAEKQADNNKVLFEQETGTWLGIPEQQKITVRGVGISGDAEIGSATLSVGTLVSNLLNSSLGYGTWSIPKDLFDKLPASARPPAIFDAKPQGLDAIRPAYLVEFTDKSEARALLERTGAFAGIPSGDVSAYPFGSGTLFVDELRGRIQQGLFIAIGVVGAIAAIVLWGMIGRIIADSRRESAVFRAIGAERGDIAGIYGIYALLLSLRVACFALILGVAIAFIVDMIFSGAATTSAQLAYAAVNTNIRFRFFDFSSWYIVLILGIIIFIGMIASILPIILGARRNPIQDMREDG